MSEKPLNVRCAKALGCKVRAVPHFGQIRHECGCDDKRHAKAVPIPYDFDSRLHDYGDDTREGWACTGPLMERFGLCTMVNLKVWHCYDSAQGNEVGDHKNPCAAIADWVAKYAPPREGDGA